MLMMIIKILQNNNDKPYHILHHLQLIPFMTQKIWIFFGTSITTTYCNALFLLPLLLCIVISSYFIITRKRIIKNNNDHDECNNENQNKIDDVNNDNHNEDARRRKRKEQFLQSCHNAKLEYGYHSSPKGYIDLWRKKEFPTLIRPLLLKSNEVSNNNNNNKESSVVSVVRVCVDRNHNNYTKYSHEHELEVYLDYAGSSLPSLTLLNNIHELSIKKQIMANPHSSGIAASRSMEMIEIVKKKVLQFFDAEPGPLNYTIPCKDYGTSNKNVSDYHPGYDVIFTSGATESLRIIGEYFQWNDISTCNKTMDKNRKSLFVYPQSVHTSVIGIRELALAKGASFMCETNTNIFGANIDTFRRWECCSDGCTSNQNSNVKCNKEDIVNNLLVLPLECNFGGMRFDNAKTIIELSRKETDDPNSSCYKWYTMLDIAKAACTQSIHLREIDPDFACVSFYKIFGEPTGLGALLVKRSSKHVITSRLTETVSLEDKKTRHYFGGGAVDVVLPGTDFVSPRSNISSLTHGTINFRGIMSLIPCFDEIQSFGGMKKISSHTRCLALEAVKRLDALRHENDKKAIVIYGTWPNYNKNSSSFIPLDQLPGPTIAFNVIRHDGSFVGYNEVSKLAALYKTPIQLRTGCFCNTGACQEALGLNDEMVKQNYLEGGHICGDEIDIINNKPTGAVRVSFGKDSIWEDLDSLIEFLESSFCSNSCMRKGHIEPLLSPRSTDVLLSEIYVYPIKSCSGEILLLLCQHGYVQITKLQLILLFIYHSTFYYIGEKSNESKNVEYE